MRTLVVRLWLLLSLPVSGQTPSSTIDPSQFDQALLEQLVKEGVDSVRVKRRLQPLLRDSVLYLAADDQAQYILKTRRLTHYQSRNRSMRTIMQRVTAFGGDVNVIGENVLFLYSGERMRNSRGRVVILNTYREVADEMVRMWVRSAGHYRNIINRAFARTGLAIAFDPATHRVIAVQVFADKGG